MKNFYDILGVSETASQDEIKKAYKKLAIENHPDSGGDQDKMKEINEAWDSLKTPEKRSDYDNARKFNTTHRSYSANQEGFPNKFDDLNDIFAHMFREPRKPRNQDIHLRLALTIEEIYSGKEVTAEYSYPEGGTESVNIKVNPGTLPGARIKYSGKGGKKLQNMPPGDLYVTVVALHHPIWSVVGNSAARLLKVNIIDILLGKKSRVECLDGSVIDVTIPKNPKTGSKIRIKGKGFPVNNTTEHTDMILVLDIEIPEINQTQQDQLKEIFK